MGSPLLCLVGGQILIDIWQGLVDVPQSLGQGRLVLRSRSTSCKVQLAILIKNHQNTLICQSKDITIWEALNLGTMSPTAHNLITFQSMTTQKFVGFMHHLQGPHTSKGKPLGHPSLYTNLELLPSS